MAISPADKLGPYEILAPVGAGGMGQVWKARDTRLDRIVAVKTSADRLSVSPDGQSILYPTFSTKTSLWMLEGFAQP